LQLANVHYVLLDEVHKVVEDMHSVSADVTRQLTDWLRDGSIRGLIGFSGTAEAYRPRFAELGMRLAHTIPLDILVGCGYVAPFAELAVPFSSSARERRIRDLLDTYKAHVLEYVKRLGPRQVREWFAAIPIDQRVVIARRSLGMYRGRADAADATRKRMLEWEQGGEIGLANSAIVSIVQLAEGCSDLQLANRAGLDLEAFNALVDELVQIRSALESLIYVPATVSRLRLSGFATTFDASQDTADALSLTIVGLNRILSDWYLRTGEGRVETIKAIIDAERSVRPVSGAIVFDSGKRIRWRQGVTTPGYEGVAGLFGQLLGDRRFSVLAALSSEMYLTCEDADPLPPRIATFIEANMMRGEVGSAIFRLALQNLDLRPEVFERLRVSFDALVRDYLASASASSSGRPGEFRRNVLRPFQRAARQELDRKTAQRLRLRLVPGNVHLAGLIATFCEYAHIAAQFRNARVAELEQVSGAREKFFVVPMGAGPRKQLMYDLTARIVDAPDLGVNLVIVSTWARTGWNVLKPNLLIDATATRDVTAWQQLRGRAMRAPRTWTNDCYRALMALSADTVSAQAAGAPSSLLSGLNTLAGDVEALRIRACEQGLNSLSADERQALRTGLVLARNKVTHIYELVKASGSARQVELDRKARTWRRSEVVERKHAYERSVDLRSGEMRRGIDHSPLVYRSDPRTDLPADLCAAVVGTIADHDRTIVEGWLRAAAAP
jgi:hypothetical protein